MNDIERDRSEYGDGTANYPGDPGREHEQPSISHVDGVEWGAEWSDGGYCPATPRRSEEFARKHARNFGTRPIRREVGPWLYADTGELVSQPGATEQIHNVLATWRGQGNRTRLSVELMDALDALRVAVEGK